MNRKVDDIIKKKLDNYDSKYPDHMWESIAKNLPEKKRKPYYIWFLVIFLAFLSYGLTYYSFNKLNKENKENRIPISDNTLNAVPATATGGSFSSVNNETGAGLAGNHNSDESNAVNGTPKNDFNSAASGIANSEGRSSVSNSIKANNIQDHNSNNFSPIAGLVPFAATASDNFLLKDNDDVSNTEIRGLAKNLEDEDQKAVTVQMASIASKRSQQVLSALSTLDLDNQLSELAKKHAALACPTFVKKQNTNTIEFYFSNDFAKRNLEIKRGDGINYLKQRTNTEVAHLSNSFGFRLGMGWESGIAFKTGLNYTSINEKFIYTDPNSIQKKTITVVKYKYDDDLNVIDSTITQEIVEIPGTNTIVSKNRYSFIDIPILFQYSIQGKKRLSYDVTVGPYVNLLVNQSGKILDESGKKIVALDNDEGNKLFKNNVGVSFYGSVAINYQLTKQMKISLEPNVRYMPSSITSYTNNLDQKYLIAGISAGVKIRI